MPQVEVTFSIDTNGILSVAAKDMATGKKQSIEIKGSTGLDKNEVEKMKHDAEAHADEDRRRREVIDLKNQADAMGYQMEKMLKEQGDKVDAQDRSNIEAAISGLREALKGDDGSAIKRAMDNLEKAGHKVAEAMYKNSATAGAGPVTTPPPAGEKPKDDKGDVIDAEYEVKE